MKFGISSAREVFLAAASQRTDIDKALGWREAARSAPDYSFPARPRV